MKLVIFHSKLLVYQRLIFRTWRIVQEISETKEALGQDVPVLPALGIRLADEDLQKAGLFLSCSHGSFLGYMVVSINEGTPIAGWTGWMVFVGGKSHLEMGDH